MLPKKIILFIFLFFLAKSITAQFCPQLGARPTGAYVVCGNITFDMPDPYFCVNRKIFVPGCTGRFNNGSRDTMYDENPFWFRFTCYQTGNLGFLITPTNLNDDYNWQLFDITGTVPNAVYSNQPIAVSGNWSGTLGVTGASSSGSGATFECFSSAAANTPAISPMPALTGGHNYLLMLSHHVGTEGFSIAFNGGNADIADPVLPHFSSVTTNCNGGPLYVKFSKKLKCATIIASDFSISPPLATPINVRLIGCDDSYETDSVVLKLDNPLPPGNYALVVKNGLDGNTVSDFCDHFIADGESIPFVVADIPAPQMDSITAPGCATDELELVFTKDIFCSSVWPDGSEFLVTGTTAVTVISARSVNCTLGEFGVTKKVKVKLSQPILQKGNYQIKLVKGNDGNTILDECGREIAVGSSLNFSTFDAVDARFAYKVGQGCIADTINYFHDGKNDVIKWRWDFGDGFLSSLQNPQILYNPFLGGTKQTKLTVSNFGCTDSTDVLIDMGPELKPAFDVDTVVCPAQPAVFKNTSKGNIVSWLWEFGNGNTSISENPPRQYYPKPVSNSVIAKLSVTDNTGCVNTFAQKISLPNNCDILVPNTFTPDGNGLNDYLYPLNIRTMVTYSFRIFNRYGIIVFETKDQSKKWDGNYDGKKAYAGTYLWILHGIDAAGRIIDERGTTLLLR